MIQTDKRQSEQAVSVAPSHMWRIAWCHTGDSGGSKRAAFEMVKELARRGHVIDEYIIRIGVPNLAHWPLRPFVRESFAYLVPPTGNNLRPYLLHAWVSLVQNLNKLRAFKSTLATVAADIRTRGYDFVHIDHCSPSYTVPLTTMLTHPTVVYSHEVSGARYEAMIAANGEGGTGPSFLTRVYRRGYEAATQTWARVKQKTDLEGITGAGLVLTNSYYSKETMFLRARRACSVCRYGVDTQTFRPLGIPVEPILLSAGRVVEAKQHHLVIEAVAGIPRARRPRVVIATPEAHTHQEAPDYTTRVIRMAEDAEVTLEICRNPSEEKLVELYNRALMLAFVPVMEPFGLVALEAMACGTPVIGVREGGIRESVREGESGYLVDRDPAELTRAIDDLLRHPEVRSRQGKQAAEYVRREWTWGKCIDRYEHEVAKLLGDGSRHQR